MESSPTVSVVVPTLNEAALLGSLLESLKNQDRPPLEVIVVDGGSTDATTAIAESYGAEVLSSPGLKEFPSRNLGAEQSLGTVLLFTGADVVFPRTTVGRITDRFAGDAELLAVAGPGIPIRPPLMLGVEYAVYNFVRYAAATLPKPLKRFSTSTNLLAVKKSVFEQLNGFEAENVNADGNFGALLSASGKVSYSHWPIRTRISSRRLHEEGFIGFNSHFLYVLENFFPFLSRVPFLKRSKRGSAARHSDMRKEEK